MVYPGSGPDVHHLLLGTARDGPDEIRKNPAKEEAMRATTHHAVLLTMAALFVLAFGAMLALDYGLFAPAEET
jgi:hypothetical protein